MNEKRKAEGCPSKPRLEQGISVADFNAFYWLKAELLIFAKQLGLPTHGTKPELRTRIERQLRGLPRGAESESRSAKTGRDSDKPLTLNTPVINYKSDAKTRAFFESQIGPEFHFTYHLNQYRLARTDLTYGDLVDEWLAERARRGSHDYRAPIAAHGKYNRFIRDFFADAANKGKSLGQAAEAWNAIKDNPGDQRYRSQKERDEDPQSEGG